jgi:ATP-dependent RNA helicase SUPV3L1/SUV3
MMIDAPARLAAVLGPTNTGKTHLAIERMLAHRSGMIGLPLRLLAREVYDKVVRRKGAAAAALVTGEERIVPPGARYFICTVEAMAQDLAVDFLAVDEIQLAADPDRGHVFTDRLLRARGQGETLLLGAETMRPMIRRLLPGAEIQHRERFSTLSYGGARKITKLPKRTAIVAFSAEEVYAIAELIRRQRGGAAVVMGALSPRTRNAQVDLYQSGEVDFLVATDAIGMGLNMDVDHVAFASRAKFDGHRNRALRPDEIAQIAGRAGRFTTDGTFGETGDCPPLDEETIARVQTHEFEPIVAVEWRSPDLDFSSIAALIRALEAPPQTPGLMRARGSTDEETLKRVAQMDEIADRVTSAADVRRLWDVCLLPDFRKATPDEHAALVASFARHLLGGGRLPADWIAREIDKLDHTTGDLDVLQFRLAHIRTWTYAANRADWIEDAHEWRGRTRQLEDKLSDALHEALSQRFIDRRTSALVRGLMRTDDLDVEVSRAGDVVVEGHFIGRLEGLDFKPDPEALGREARAVRNAALKALAPEVARRLAALAEAPAEAFRLHGDGAITANGARVARLSAGADLLKPQASLIGARDAAPVARAAALGRIEAWLAAQITRTLAPLAALDGARSALSGAGRGLAFRLLEARGALDRAANHALIEGLTKEDRALLARHGFRIGRHTIFAPALLTPRGAFLLTLLHRLTKPAGARIFRAPRNAIALPCAAGLDWADYAAAGFRALGGRAVRINAIERLATAAARARGQGRDFALDPDMAALAGGDLKDLEEALFALGYRRQRGEEGAPARWRFPAPPRAQAPPISENAFSALAALRPAPAQAARKRRKRR